MARSCLAPSPIRTTASANPNAPAVDLWTTLRVAHRVHRRNNNRPERNENCVTHVVGQNCYLCRRLLRRGVASSALPVETPLPNLESELRSPRTPTRGEGA